MIEPVEFRRLLLMRGAARVARMHTIPTYRTQTVGEHTFSLLAILDYVMQDHTVTLDLLRAALYHDVSEYITGDVPSTAKWANSGLEDSLKFVEHRIEKQYELPKINSTSVEGRILKFCDLMELGIFCLEEHWMGDYRMKDICNRVIGAIEKRNLTTITMNAWKLFSMFYSDVKSGTDNLNGVTLHVSE
jgi:5'-deoxynucleotidase YfbR-like HD superfamily hydrolase